MDPDDYYDEDEELTDEETKQMAEPKPDLAAQCADGIEVKIYTHALNTIAQAASHRICEHLQKTVTEMVNERLDAILNDAWKATLATMAQQAIEAYLTTPRAKTDEWGTPVTGKMSSLAAQIPDVVNKWLNEKVNAKGDVETYDRNGAKTRTQWMLQTMVVDQLSAETKKAASDVTEKAREVVRSHVGRFVAEQMVPAISVDGGRA